MTRTQKSSEINFSKSLARLEEIVEKLENPDMDLEEGMKLLEEGIKLHKQCENILRNTQNKVNEILKVEGVK